MESISKNTKRIFSSPPRPAQGDSIRKAAKSESRTLVSVSRRSSQSRPLANTSEINEDGRIRVFVRFREDSRKDPCVLKDPDNEKAVIYVPGQSPVSNFQGQKLSLKVFNFDDVLDSQASQEEVYNVVAQPIVSRFLQGFNGAILAYGQSGSGKTYTIEGTITDATRRGIVARASETIFERLQGLQQQADTYRCILEASMIEVYCEKLRDLLCKDSDKKASLKIREDLEGNSTVEGVTKLLICNENALLAVLLNGQQRRSVGETALNSNSSRSHTILSLTLSIEDRQSGFRQQSILFFVDLAGSERIAKSKCEGVKFEEGKNINQSLTTLGIVINALSNKDAFVPYRDSKLTRILRSALGGNSLTTLICCVSSSRLNEFETLSTLKFGQRCSRITNSVYQDLMRPSDNLEKKKEILVKEIEALTTYATSLELWIHSVGLKLPLDIYTARSAAMSLPDLEMGPDVGINYKHDLNSERSSSLSSSSCDVETTCFPPIQSKNVALSRIGSSEREMRSSAADNRSVIDHRMSFANSLVDEDIVSIPRPLSVEFSGEGGLASNGASCAVSPVVALISLQRQFQDLACRHAECKTELYKAEAEMLTKDEQIDTLQESLKSSHEQYNMLLTQYERISTRSSIGSQQQQLMYAQPPQSKASPVPKQRKAESPLPVARKKSKDLCSNHRHEHLQDGGDEARVEQTVAGIQPVPSPPTPPRSHY